MFMLVVSGSVRAATEDTPWQEVSSLRTPLKSERATLFVKQCAGPEPAKVNYIVFNESRCELRVIKQGPSVEVGKPLGDMLKASGAIGGVNGGYFKAPNLIPSGMEISRGSIEGVAWRGDPRIGSCVVRKGTIFLEWDSEWKGTDDASELVQCSPWLISGGIVATALSSPSDQRLHRTFIATDSRKNWVLGTCEKMTLAGMASMLASQKVVRELNIDRALNLDGGPSSGLWAAQADGKEFSFRGLWNVRNALGVFVR